jgi:hypothetical protein
MLQGFDVPTPVPESLVSSTLSSWVFGAQPAISTLQRRAHTLVSWEQLVAEGATLEAIARCHPRSVAAWARTHAGACVTWEQILELPTDCTAPCSMLLAAWGPDLCPESVRMLRLDFGALERAGVTQAHIDELRWPKSRWEELFRAVPSARTKEDAFTPAGASVAQLKKMRL